MHSECVGHFWGVSMATRHDSNTSSIISYFGALFDAFLLSSILASICVVVGIIDGLTDDFHCI